VLTTPSNASPISSAVDCVVEIALGTIIGIVVSIFVLPSRARRNCFERSAEMLTLAQVLQFHLQRLAAANLEGIEHLNQRARVELAKVEAAAERPLRSRRSFTPTAKPPMRRRRAGSRYWASTTSRRHFRGRCSGPQRLTRTRVLAQHHNPAEPVITITSNS
jgi:hypothetical protein